MSEVAVILDVLSGGAGAGTNRSRFSRLSTMPFRQNSPSL